MTLFERWKELGIVLEKPENGILLIAKGDFNDADDVEQTWRFQYDDLGLVMWLLEHYERGIHHWEEVLTGKERKLFAQYAPGAYDTTSEIRAHTIYDAHAYVFENGVCKEIKVGETYEIPSTDSLYEKYYDDDYDW